jgi:hypothetical protein
VQFITFFFFFFSFSSQGVDASTFDAGDERVWPEIAAMQFVAKISHLNLFLIPADDIRNCAPAISLFELTIVCSDEGLEVLKNQRRKSREEASNTASNNSNLSSNLNADPFSGLLYRMLGVDGILGVAKNAVSSLANYLVPSASISIESGTSRWQKTFFLLSRADHVLRGAEQSAGQQEQLFYELGLAFGARLSYLQPPAFSRLALLALPEKQLPELRNPFVGFLPELKAYLLRVSADASHDSSRDDAIIQMAETLEKEMSSGWISMAYLQVYFLVCSFLF